MHAGGMIERYRDDQSGDCSTKRDYSSESGAEGWYLGIG
jgi:hypothetical protein